MSKAPKSKAQRERDSEQRAERMRIRKASAEPKDARGRTPQDRRAESADRKEQERRDAVDRAKAARTEALVANAAAGGELIEDFGMDGCFDDAGNKVLAPAGPRMPAAPRYDLVPFKGEVVDASVEMAYAMEPEQRAMFLSKYAESGNIGAAAWHAGTSIDRTVRLRKADPLFDAQVHEAAERFKASLECEAVRRGRDGWQEPVFSQQNMCVIGYKRMFDGRLLEKLLTKNMPEKYGEKVSHTHEVQGVLVLREDKPITPQEWLNEYGDAHEAKLAEREQVLIAEGKRQS